MSQDPVGSAASPSSRRNAGLSILFIPARQVGVSPARMGRFFKPFKIKGNILQSGKGGKVYLDHHLAFSIFFLDSIFFGSRQSFSKKLSKTNLHFSFCKTKLRNTISFWQKNGRLF